MQEKAKRSNKAHMRLRESAKTKLFHGSVNSFPSRKSSSLRYSVICDNGIHGSCSTIKGVNLILGQHPYGRAKVRDYRSKTDTYLRNSMTFNGRRK